MSPNLVGRICLVTGGSSGIGRGIALQLGQSGATVYVTGRNKVKLDSCCEDIKSRGGQGIPVIVDHSNPDEVENLFQKISQEQNGKLDVLVNNAYAAVELIMNQMGKPFWENPAVETWDTVNNVGLRNHYICSVHAARLMVPRKSGVIINVSSGGGLKYLFNVAYGVGKAACDRMAQDCAFELKKHNVACVALWPGPVQTETIQRNVLDNTQVKARNKTVFDNGETLEFSGKAVAHLVADSNIMGKSGRVLLSADLAREYGFTDTDGAIHGDMRSVKSLLAMQGWQNVAAYVPSFIRIPHFLMYYAGYKF